MSIAQIVARRLPQTAVYWGSPVSDGHGGFTYADPVEIVCRWEEMIQLVTDAKGKEVTSRATVFVSQDVDEEGVLYLGTLDSLDDYLDSSSGSYINPKDVDGAYEIKKFDKIPELNSAANFLRVVYLTPSLSFGGF